MTRPQYELTWQGIRRYWRSKKKEPNTINRSISNYHSKSPSEPFLNNGFELLPNNVINIDDHNQDSFSLLNARENHRSNSTADFSVPLVSKIQRSRHHPDLSKVSHACDTEMIRSELRIIISQLVSLTKHIRLQEENDDESQDWKFAAMVIDRLCLIIFTVSMILFTALTLFATPDVFKFG